jgi:hypothetical protein
MDYMKSHLKCVLLISILFLSATAMINVISAADPHDVYIIDDGFGLLVNEYKRGEEILPRISTRNNGSNTETITIKVYYNSSYPTTIPDTLIQSYTITNLGAGLTNQTDIPWDTTGRSEGVYLIKANAEPVTGQTEFTGMNRTRGVSIIVHDVVVTDVYASPTGVTAGQSVEINATVWNNGVQAETFDVTPYYADTAAASSQTVTSLAVDAEKNLTFTWDTTSVSDGSYAIKVSADVVSGEIIRQVNNNLTTTDILPYGVVRIPVVHDIAVATAFVNTSIIEVGEIVKFTAFVENQGDAAETFDVTFSYGSTTAGSALGTAVGKRNSTKETYPQAMVNFEWDTTGIEYGNFSLSAEADPVLGETDTADNVYSSVLFRLLTPVLRVQKIIGEVGKTYNVKIMVSLAKDLHAWQVLIGWNTSHVDVFDAVEGDFFADQPQGTSWLETWRSTRVTLSCSTLGVGVPGLDGSGWLASINLTVIAAGESVLNLTYIAGQSYLLDSLGYDIPCTLENGEVILPWDEDVNIDGIVNIFDLAIVAINWGKTGGAINPPRADVNGDNVVNIYDLSAVALKYGQYAGY